MARLVHHFVTLCMAALGVGIAAGLIVTGSAAPFLAAALGAAGFLIALLAREAMTARERRVELDETVSIDHVALSSLRMRVEQIEARLKTLEMGTARGEADQTSVEIATLGALVKDLAETVARQDVRLGSLAGLVPRTMAPSPVTRPVSPASVPLQPAMLHASAPERAAPPAPAHVAPAGIAAAPPQFTPSPPPAVGSAIVEAIEAGRIDIHLQPVVSLPQRKPRLYEALPQIKTGDGRSLAWAEAGPAIGVSAQASGFDRYQFLRCMQIIRRLASRNRELALVMNLSFRSLADRRLMDEMIDIARAAPDVARQLVLEISQTALQTLDARQAEHLRLLSVNNYRISVDEVRDLTFDPRQLAARGIRFVKVPAAVLLGPAPEGLEIRLEDLGGLLARHGIELIADGIESESAVVDLLDLNLPLGQGRLFAPPRPVRADVVAPEEQAADAVLSMADAEPAASKAVAEPLPPAEPEGEPAAETGPLTLGEAALYRTIDRFRDKDNPQGANESGRPQSSAWRTLARRVQSRERA